MRGAKAAAQRRADRGAERSDRDALAIGDFDTCGTNVDEPGAIDVVVQLMDSMDAIGFFDLWRHRYPDRTRVLLVQSPRQRLSH